MRKGRRVIQCYDDIKIGRFGTYEKEQLVESFRRMLTREREMGSYRLLRNTGELPTAPSYHTAHCILICRCRGEGNSRERERGDQILVTVLIVTKIKSVLSCPTGNLSRQVSSRLLTDLGDERNIFFHSLHWRGSDTIT